MMKEKSFHYLSSAEKQALFEFLAGTRSQRSLDTLGSLIRKVGRFARPRVIETGLLAVTAIGKTDTPQAAEALEKGCRSSHPRLRKKCRDIRSKVNPT